MVSQLPDRGVGRVGTWLKEHDACAVVPLWTFFAPNPRTTDQHLLYRDRLPTKGVGPWRELKLREPRRVSHAVWNPQKREEKALADIISALVRTPQWAKEPRVLMLGDPYLALLVHVASRPTGTFATSRQFVVVAMAGSGDLPVVLLLSGWHRLGLTS